MRRTAAAIIQWREGWCGVTFNLRQKREITGLTLYADKSLPELEKRFEESGYGIGLENSAAYLFNLTFPFSDKRKISLVITNELEERMPVTVDDMVVDFVEVGKGRVLAGAMARSFSNEHASNKRVRITTIQGLAALYALKWFDRVRDKDFVFLHMNGDAIVVMAYKDNTLYQLRQFFYSPLSNSLHDAFEEMAADPDFSPRSYILVADSSEGAKVKEYLETTFQLSIETPLLKESLVSGDGPDWLWDAVGVALLSLKPKGHLDFTRQKGKYAFLSTKTGFYLSAGLAAFGLLMYGLAYTDYYLKQRTYRFLTTEPSRVYRLSFPKSPPVQDPIRTFRDKIHALEQKPDTTTGATTPLTVLDEISKSIPPDIDVKLNEFTSDEKEFSISGTTVSFAAIERIRDSIGHVPGISQVEVQNLELAANKQVKFKLKGRL